MERPAGGSAPRKPRQSVGTTPSKEDDGGSRENSQGEKWCLEAVKPLKVVEGQLVYKGEIKVGRSPPMPVCKVTGIAPPVHEDPDSAAESFARDYDGCFPETTEHDICTTVKLRGTTKLNSGGRENVKAQFTATGHLVVESLHDSSHLGSEELVGQDLFSRESIHSRADSC